jgi:CDP-paratose 2-epimerase
VSGSNGRPPTPILGVLEWFEPNEHERVERVLAGLRELGIEHLRTGLSWAGWHVDGGRQWYDWLLPRLASEVEVLPCIGYTPPSLGLVPRSSSPPRRPRDYADFVDTALTRYGRHFEAVELWNEPNSRAEWDWTLDPSWELFAEMAGAAAHWAKHRGWRTVLGGMSPIDPGWLALMVERGVVEWIDVVGVHGFPGTWEPSWDSWGRHVEDVRAVLPAGKRIWITEVGYSTWRHDELGQLRTLLDALTAPVERVYWYAAEDLAEERSTIERFHEDEREYHFGLRTVQGRPKLLSRMLAGGDVPAVRETALLASRRRPSRRPVALVTGGAGFVGTNLADRLLLEGHRVRVLDSLRRPGVERNLHWLVGRHGDRVEVEVADIRDRFAVRRAVDGADQVFHFAAQVAVTTSVDDPAGDFDVNLGGAVNLLEALRQRPEPPPLVFTSTNKVYGALADLPLTRRGDRWEPVDDELRGHGLDETRPLEFSTPYGCSKGGADQYVLDYAKTFGLPATVFRMSCIYGPHQHGTEDQGWVAHFLIRALTGQPITLYGDGAQVRDLLFVDDLVQALLRARDGIDRLAGLPFNIGGGGENAVSLLEVLDLIAAALGERPRVRFADERVGDQRYYVADSRRLRAATGWRPLVGVEEGVVELASWLRAQKGNVTGRLRAAAR